MMSAWTTIPGETPIDDLSGLIPSGISTRRQLNVVEAENILKAVLKYLAARPTRRAAPFDSAWAQQLHFEMFGDVWRWAGQFRTKELNLGVPWIHVPTKLRQLFDDLKYWENDGTDLMEQAVMLHHRAVSIHPFLNGNGRWARMLANIWLKLHGSPPTEWPEETIGAESTIRADYLAAVRAADNGKYAPLIELHKRYSPTQD